jgi:hypothetical protein
MLTLNPFAQSLGMSSFCSKISLIQSNLFPEYSRVLKLNWWVNVLVVQKVFQFGISFAFGACWLGEDVFGDVSFSFDINATS